MTSQQRPSNVNVVNVMFYDKSCRQIVCWRAQAFHVQIMKDFHYVSAFEEKALEP